MFWTIYSIRSADGGKYFFFGGNRYVKNHEQFYLDILTFKSIVIVPKKLTIILAQ